MVLDIIYMVLTITIYDLYDQYNSNIEIPTPFPFSCEKRETFINGGNGGSGGREGGKFLIFANIVTTLLCGCASVIKCITKFTIYAMPCGNSFFGVLKFKT